jgi:crotonyl-CoA carboxylase/reductase
MPAHVLRAERCGHPRDAFALEDIPVWSIGPGEALVLVMAAGVNYNGVWAARGEPVPVHRIHGEAAHVTGSDASGIVWAVGSAVEGWKVGDHVVVHCNQSCGQCHRCHGGDPLACAKQRIWGYETPDGSFALFTRVQAQQLLRKPAGLTWEEAASYGLTCFTAHRMLLDRAGLKTGEDVLIWGGGGGLGVFAIQFAKLVGARVVAVASTDARLTLARALGADGVIDRREFPSIGFRPGMSAAEEDVWLRDVKNFGRRLWQVFGERKGPDVVFEHVGQATFPASVFLAERFGRVVICGATTGYRLEFDARHLWMRQKSIVGSHFADAGSAYRANTLIEAGRVRPVLTRTFGWDEIPLAHDLMERGELSGTVACLVGAPTTGLSDYR